MALLGGILIPGVMGLILLGLPGMFLYDFVIGLLGWPSIKDLDNQTNRAVRPARFIGGWDWCCPFSGRLAYPQVTPSPHWHLYPASGCAGDWAWWFFACGVGWL